MAKHSPASPGGRTMTSEQPGFVRLTIKVPCIRHQPLNIRNPLCIVNERALAKCAGKRQSHWRLKLVKKLRAFRRVDADQCFISVQTP